jgi:Ring finger domain
MLLSLGIAALIASSVTASPVALDRRMLSIGAASPGRTSNSQPSEANQESISELGDRAPTVPAIGKDAEESDDLRRRMYSPYRSINMIELPDRRRQREDAGIQRLTTTQAPQTGAQMDREGSVVARPKLDAAEIVDDEKLFAVIPKDKQGEDTECTVCQVKPLDETSVIIQCGHGFHKECIKYFFNLSRTWIESQTNRKQFQETCPTCRAEIFPASLGKAVIAAQEDEDREFDASICWQLMVNACCCRSRRRYIRV